MFNKIEFIIELIFAHVCINQSINHIIASTPFYVDMMTRTKLNSVVYVIRFVINKKLVPMVRSKKLVKY